MSAGDSLEAAEEMFSQVLSSDAPAPYQANAAVGLANVAETRGDFDAAAKHWDKAKIIADESNLTTISTLVDLRIGMLDDLKRPIIFGESDESFDFSEDAADDEAAAAEAATEATAQADQAADQTDDTTGSAPGQ